jgi:hypothetical protein
VLIKTRCIVCESCVCESCGFMVLLRSLSVFRVSSRAVGVPALSSRLMRLPSVFSSTLSGACSDWGGLAGARRARRCQPTGNHLRWLGWLHWNCPLGLWRALSLTETILTRSDYFFFVQFSFYLKKLIKINFEKLKDLNWNRFKLTGFSLIRSDFLT